MTSSAAVKVRSKQMRSAAAIAVALAVAGALTTGVARAATAPPVQWCGTGPAAKDLPDAVAGPQVHVIYAFPSDGTDRFGVISSGIATDLSAGVAWWQARDFSRAPRFDLAAFPCAPSLGALDISDVRLPHDSSYYAASASLFNALDDDLVGAGFANLHKKYLVYYDSPVALSVAACGQGHEDPTVGGASGYAEVFLAPDRVSDPTSDGCGDIATPANRGGYSAIVAVHEMLHTFGALDTTANPGPPHACPGDPAHSCDPGDNMLDIMRPSGVTYWLDDTFLDFGNDDYYGMPASDTWWDVQDSVWLRHLNAPTFTLDISPGAGVASTTSDLPGVECTAHCASTWDANTSVTLTATPQLGYSRVVWGGACAGLHAGTDCTLVMTANQPVSVSFLKTLAVASFAAPRQVGKRLQVQLRLNRAPAAHEASIACRATTGLKLVAHAIAGNVASCAWSVPPRLHGRRVTGHITVSTDSGGTLGRAWSLKLRR
jgi:hypothetical protein